jgi:hypothetical protein
LLLFPSSVVQQPFLSVLQWRRIFAGSFLLLTQ